MYCRLYQRVTKKKDDALCVQYIIWKSHKNKDGDEK